MGPRLVLRSYVVYYGYGPLPGLDGYDLAVLEPAGWTPDALRALQATGTRALAYVSGLEASEPVRQRLGLGRQDLLMVEGAPWRRPEFGTVVVDPRSRTWRASLEAQVHGLMAQGWDGVFLDGLGDVEDDRLAQDSTWLAPAAAALVRQVRLWVGRRLLVMNNGLWRVLPLAAPYLDGVCWEGDRIEAHGDEPWAAATLEGLARAALEHGVTPLLLTVVPPGPEEAQRLSALEGFARRHGLVAYAAPADYAQAIRSREGKVIAARTAPA